MSTSSREKQALGVFVVLIVLGFCGLCWYLVAGHSWNVAASAIDEKVGQMDGYTAIVYAGTVLPEVEPAVASAASSSSSAQSASEGASGASTTSSQSSSMSASASKKNSSASKTDAGEARTDAASGLTSDIDSIAAPVIPDANGDVSEAGNDKASSSSAAKTSGNAAAASFAQSTENAEEAESSALADSESGDTTEHERSSETDGSTTEASSSSTLGAEGAEARSNLTTKKSDPVLPDDVCASYEGKGAQVLVLDTMHPSVYEDGVIIKRGQKRIGVFSVDVPLSEEAAQERIAYFKEAKVDMVVCLSSVRSYVRNAQGIDVVVTLQDDDVSTMGANANGTFYVNAPKLDTVGAILVSPSNVVSAKVLESL